MSRRWTSSRLGDLLRDRRAVGAVEFAIIAPVLLFLYIGGVELTIALTLDRKVKQIAITVSDLVTQDGEFTAAKIDDILGISSSFLYPYRLDRFGSEVTALKIDAAGQAVVAWSRGSGTMKASAAGATFTLPTELAHLRDTFLIRAGTAYLYTPAGGYGLNEPFHLTSTSYASPRIGGTVDCDDCS